MRAVVLAGGRGTRLTEAPPGSKAAAMFGGRPLLAHALSEVQGVAAEVVCIVDGAARDIYRDLVDEAGATVHTTWAATPCDALRPVISLGERMLIMHADEVCLDSHPELYGKALDHFDLPVVGVDAARDVARLEIAKRSTDRMRIALGGRLPDRRGTGSAVGDERRYIGRYMLTVDRDFIAGLEAHESILEALKHGRREVIELNIPKRYFDCGTDARIAESRRRLGELS